MKMTRSKTKTIAPRFPANLLAPVGNFLQNKLKALKKQKKNISSEDPFNDTSRISDNAATDTEAEEQFGHARTSALQKEINRKIIQVRKALSRVRIGKYGICEDCGQMIDTDRLLIFPEATYCAKDARRREK